MPAKANMILRRRKLRRDQILRDFNASTLDDVGPVGGEKFLKELNEMQDLQSKAGRRRSDR